MASPANLPSVVAQKFTEQGVDTEALLFFARADMDSEFRLADCWLVINKECIYILSGKAVYPKERRKLRKKQADRKPPEPISYETRGFACIVLSEIEKISVETLFSIGCLVTKNDDRYDKHIRSKSSPCTHKPLLGREVVPAAYPIGNCR